MANNNQYQGYDQYSNQYGNQYTDQYSNQYGNQYGNQYSSQPSQYYQTPVVPGMYPPQVQVIIPPHRYHQPLQSQNVQPTPQQYPQPGLGFDGAQELRYEQCPPTNGYQHANIENVPPRVAPQAQTPTRTVTKPQVRPQNQVSEQPLDYELLLLSLADEYLDAAHGHGMLVALAERRAQADDYYRLVATALGCIESVLNHYKLQPLKEGQVRLRYAQILFEETENDLDAETTLSKGIELCERNKLLDLKYTMQTLLARVLHRSNPKAAMKAIDGMVDDVEVYHHTAYVYVFRFLRATTSLSTGSHQDVVAATNQLQKIGALARQQNDYVIFAFAAVMESLVSLQGSGQDSVVLAQRALATARAVQLNPEIVSSPQMQILMEFIDLCCSLQETNVDQIGQKLHSMQHTMDQIVDDPNWLNDGTLYLSLTKRSMNGIQLSNSGVIVERNGKPCLAMKWLPKGDVYALGYLLSTVGMAHKNASDGHKAEKFLEEGLRLVRAELTSSETAAGSLLASTERTAWRRLLECQCLLEKVFLLCARSRWESARDTLDEIDLIGHDLGTSYPPELSCIAKYLDGTIYQGTGDLTTALSIFRSPPFTIPQASNKMPRTDTRRDISLLAALNTIMIVHSPKHASHHLLQPLLAEISPYFQKSNTSSPLLQSAHSLVASILTGLAPGEGRSGPFTETSTPILRTKKYLGAALTTARSIGAAQIVSLSLALMTDKFFRGVVGDQAEKSARASAAMAKKSGNKLWTSVCDGMLAETLTMQGKRDEAVKARGEALRVLEALPDALKRTIET